ncbi:MAG TPA: hypothetical protein VF723_10105 [Pyrinomonadaceae bacterium]|jgi:hypothetical protein
MNCQSCRIEIEELETAERPGDAAGAHLRACAPCRTFYSERLALRQLVGSLEPVSAPPDFDFRLRARLAANKATHTQGFLHRVLAPGAPAVALAVSCAVLIAAALVYNQLKPGSSGVHRAAGAAVQPGAAQIAGQKSEGEPRPGGAVAASPASTAAEPAGISQPDKALNRSVEDVNGSRHTRPRLALAGGKQGPRRDSIRIARTGAPSSNDAAVRPAPLITPSGGPLITAGSNPVIEIPVRPSTQPLRVMVKESRNSRRTVPLEPVVFGSQDILEHGGAAASASQGIW